MYPEWTRNTYPVVPTSTAKSDFALYYLFRLAFILHCTRDNRSRVTLNRCIHSSAEVIRTEGFILCAIGHFYPNHSTHRQVARHSSLSRVEY